MKTCPYCSTGVSPDENTGFATCSFCEMKVKPAEDGQRERVRIYKPVSDADMKLPPGQYMEWNTYRLMELLKKLREERRSYYGLMRPIKNAGNISEEFKQEGINLGNQYEAITKRTFAVENILRERIGYIPRKVTENTLSLLADRMEDERNLKPMQISKPQEQKPPPREQSIER